MSTTVRVYINGQGVDVPSPATAFDAVGIWDPGVARAVAAGERTITDSRGLPADPKAGVYNGAILRIVRARPQTAPDSDESVMA